MRTASVKYKGEDVFGPFKVTGGPCDICGTPEILTIGYLTTPILPLGIRLKDTILQDEGNYIGINCGDYAKFHRQVAHIQDRIAARQERLDKSESP